MRFTVSSTALSSKLNALSRVINSKNSLPILADFLFDIQDNVLRLTASDSENVMNTQVELTDCDGNGRFAIGNHDLLEGVKGFSEQPITFDVNLQENIVKISYQNGMFSLPIENADEYPQAQLITDGANTITISSDLLAENINRSVFATAQDELRPVMNGIYFDLTPECLAIVASDGHKLVRNRVYGCKAEVPASFILPKKPATLLRSVLSTDGADVTISFNQTNAEIHFSDGMLSCRLIEGRYPNYNSVIPQDNPNALTLDRKSFISAMRRVMPFASESTQLIKLRLEYNSLEINAEDHDFATSARETITCEYGGMPMSIGFKGSALYEICNNISSDDIVIELADPGRAGLISPAQQPEGEDILMLIMPMLLNE